MASLIAVLSALLALAGRAAGHITFSPNTVVKAPYFTTQMVIGHGSAGQSTQVISIQTPYGVKVTPEQKPGWNLSIVYRNLTVPIPSTHGSTYAVPDVITYSAQAGYALPNEWLFEAFFSIQLLGDDGHGCVYGTPGVPAAGSTGYTSAWYGDVLTSGGSSAAPQLGFFFPTTVTLIPNYQGAGVGNDPTNLQLLSTWCSPPGKCQTNWTGIPSGSGSWIAALPLPAPYIVLPVSAWPACTGGVMSFAGANYTTTTTPGATVASAATSARAAATLLAAGLAALLL